MPRVTFVNEHRVVEAVRGATVAAIAGEAGIAIGNVCFCEGMADATSARTWIESIRGMRGWRRLPARVRVLGDVRVWSAPAASDRVAVARPIDAPPSPVLDPSAPRKPLDAASSSAHVHGHRDAVGRGMTPEVPPPVDSRPNAARPISTMPPPPDPNDDGKM